MELAVLGQVLDGPGAGQISERPEALEFGLLVHTTILHSLPRMLKGAHHRCQPVTPSAGGGAAVVFARLLRKPHASSRGPEKRAQSQERWPRGPMPGAAPMQRRGGHSMNALPAIFLHTPRGSVTQQSAATRLFEPSAGLLETEQHRPSLGQLSERAEPLQGRSLILSLHASSLGPKVEHTRATPKWNERPPSTRFLPDNIKFRPKSSARGVPAVANPGIPGELDPRDDA
jgi:hypothetical protein